jgi:hypothetical protein
MRGPAAMRIGGVFCQAQTMIMPNFLIIGAAKAGTTALYHYLNQHPQIYMSPVKEPYFFEFEGKNGRIQGPYGLRKSYITDLENYQKLYSQVKDEIAIGEASPGYLDRPQAPERIKHYVPDAKLIAILRNPVERAYSNYLMMVRLGHEPLLNFSQALADEENRIKKQWSFVWYYKQRGFYYRFLKRYFSLFDQSQVRVYLYDDYQSSNIAVLQDVFKFLNVDSDFQPDVTLKHNISCEAYFPKRAFLHHYLKPSSSVQSTLRKVLPGKVQKQLNATLMKLNQGEKPPLHPEAKQSLIVEYRDDILKLQDLLNQDLSKWLEID